MVKTFTGLSSIDVDTVTTTDLEVDSGTLSVDETNDRVGINTTSPSSDLHIVNSGNSELIVQSGASSSSKISLGDSSDTDICNFLYNNSTNTFSLTSNTTSVLSIDSSAATTIGNGTTRLTINDNVTVSNGHLTVSDSNMYLTNTSGSADFQITTSSSGTGTITFWDSFAVGQIKYDHSDNSLTFTNGSDHLVIDAAGAITGPTSLTLSNSSDSDLIIENTGNNTNISRLTLRKERIGSAVSSGDTLGLITVNGYDGSAYRTAGQIRIVADDDAAASDVPAYMSFSVNSGSAVVTEKMRITSDGRFKLSNQGGAPDTSAVVDLSTSLFGGVKFPTMSTTSQNNISSPIQGLLIYNTTIDSSFGGLAYYTGGDWRYLTSSYSGTYTPSATNVSNTSSYNFNPFFYHRSGQFVQVSGSGNFIVGTSSADGQFRFTIPISSTFTNDYECNGGYCVTGYENGSGVYSVGCIRANTANNEAELLITLNGTPSSNRTVYAAFQFSYRII